LLDLLYGTAVGVRRRWYERHPEARRRLRQPVVSVGNLSVGGTGKTPLVALICEWLLERGERPAILSRGYGRRPRDNGVTVVSDGTRVMADLDRAGDEPLMLANQMSGVIVAVCEDRHLAGIVAERRFGATVHVLDDGFQHLSLARELDILVTSPGEIANGRVLPLGRLRERVDAAARADVVVVMDTDGPAARSEAWTLGISQSAGGRRVLRASPTGPLFAVASIGNPQQFFDGLRAAGFDIRGTRAFRDHHRYSARDLTVIADAMRTGGAEQVVTTAKDAVRLEPLGPAPFTWTAVPMSLELDPPDALFASLEAALSRARETA
jgi:tetraacyldisaccharide 4'-kinase